MLLNEADAAGLAKKQAVIDRLKKDLKAAGIKYREVGSTAIDIFNKVTVMQPIYTAVATREGGINVVDKSAERLKATKLPDGAEKLYGTYGSNGKLSTLTPGIATNKFATDYFDMGGTLGQKRHYISNSKVYVDSNALAIASNGDYLYGHIEMKKIDDGPPVPVLVSVDTVKNGEVVTYKQPGKRALKKDPAAQFEWYSIQKEFRANRGKLSPEQMYQAAASYIIQTIDSTTINVALKGGKDKYVIEPAKQLADALQARLGGSAKISDNLSEVSNTNANNPQINVDLGTGLKLLVVLKRPSIGVKGVTTVVYNLDKTILYNDIRGNIEKLNDSDYRIQVCSYDTYAERDEDTKLVFNYNADLIVDYIMQAITTDYLSGDKLKNAIARKQQYDSTISKVKANADARALQQQRDAARAEKIAAKQDAAEAEARAIKQNATDELDRFDARKRELQHQARSKKYKAGDLNKAVDALTSDPDAYNAMLDRLADSF